MKWYASDPSQTCVARNAAGAPFEEFSCLYPKLLGRTYTRWEIGYDPVPVRDWMVQRPWVPVVACLLYGLFIVAGQSHFRSRPAWNARPLLALWNLALSVFSFLGFVRVAPAVVHLYSHYTWQENFCMDPESHYGSGSTGLWVQLFILSKFPELIDTVFIVIHKKPLIFLHWYHHISVLLYCWHSYVQKSPVGILFCVMNYAVHALMYFYYFLMAIHRKPKWLNAFWITVAQISQMIVGVGVTIVGWYLMLRVKVPGGCWLTPDNNFAALIMYGSYLALFVQFFVQRYLGKPTPGRKASSKTQLPSGSTSTKRAGTANDRKDIKRVPRRKEE